MSNNQPKVKILISYHKPSVLLQDDVLTPIHVGRALATESSKDGNISEEDYQWMLDNMIGDDTGDNISYLNREFCELTAMYWAWKNYDKLGNPEYIGFMHYRRHLIINKDVNDRTFDSVYFDYIDENYLNNFLIQSKNINEIIASQDIITTYPVFYEKDVYEQFDDLAVIPFSLNKKIFDKVLDYIRLNHIDYIDALDIYLKSKEHHWFNSFILKKEIFLEYSDFLFDILLNVYKTIDLQYETVNGQRVLAYIAERIYGIFITHLLNKDKNINIKYLQLSNIKNTYNNTDLYPNQKDSICVCFSIDDSYIPQLSTIINSLIENSNDKYLYEIFVINTNVSTSNKNIIKQQEKNNIKIKFIDIDKYIQNIYKYNFYTYKYFTISTYLRFFIPEIFKNFDKILYLDTDMIILNDVSLLYKIDITNYVMAASRDLGTITHMYNERYKDDIDDNSMTMYLKSKIGLEKPYDYFQAGVILFNIKEAIKFNLTVKCINKSKEIKNPIFVDQDILNSVCYGHVKFFENSWDFDSSFYINNKYPQEKLPINLYLSLENAYKNPNIIHYCGENKPWKYTNQEKSYFWWKYARNTPFYEDIIYKYANINDTNNITNINNTISESRFSIGDFIFSILNNYDFLEICILGIRIKIKKKYLNNDRYNSFMDRIFSIYKNEKYKRITILGIKITTRQDKTRQDKTRQDKT